VLDEALFTAPAHPLWGGAALIGADGRLLGIGSLLVEERVGEHTVQGNMMVPVELLDPILEDLVTRGRANRPPRPWLGAYITEVDGHPILAGFATGGPAERIGLQVGDRVLEVAGEPVAGLADLFRRVWRVGPAGVEVPLTISRRGARSTLRVPSADRADFLKKPHLH
jgi:S1-C subfamily serine protease